MSKDSPHDLDEQEPHGCRFIHGDPGTGPWFYCQEQIAPGGKLGDVSNPPYCRAHRAQLYKPQSPYVWTPGKYDRVVGRSTNTIDANVILKPPGAGDGPRLPVDLLIRLANKGLKHD